MNRTLAKTITLESGYDMPVFGLGTWEMRGPSCERAVAEAIDIGYRAVDTAELYENEVPIGRAIESCPREELFITSKVSNEHLAPANIMAACQGSLQRLRTDYLDLYLVHWPNDAFSLEEIRQFQSCRQVLRECLQQRRERFGIARMNGGHLGVAGLGSEVLEPDAGHLLLPSVKSVGPETHVTHREPRQADKFGKVRFKTKFYGFSGKEYLNGFTFFVRRLGQFHDIIEVPVRRYQNS